ncbi:type I DNA topoisomerase [bacterium]|nr:type I DNA topoisomerase [bacterium]
MSKPLVIVESPTKAKTIGGMLGNKFKIMSTMGHIRDLPKSKIGIDIDNNFEPKYEIISAKKSLVSKLRKAAQECDEIYLATDEDREGEAIAWHIAFSIGKDLDQVKRVAFHEIIPEAIKKAFDSPRPIYLNLVNSQQARRVLDRLVGYTLSPFLAKNLERGLSAGRVQSVALRLIVEREKEIEAFTPEIYWLIKAEVEKEGKGFTMQLVRMDDKKLDRHFLKKPDDVNNILDNLNKGELITKDKKESIRKVKPYPPFITSTLQQEASIRLSFSSTKTMLNAQQLYEGISIEDNNIGLITYMRTDSPSVAKPALNQALKHIKETFGENYLPKKPFFYKSKSSTAQEAHEAIRPTSVDMTPEKVKPYLNEEQHKLYSLIWNRFVASQMKEAEIKNVTLTAENGRYTFETTNNSIHFDGFMKIWEVKIDQGEKDVPDFKEGETIPVTNYIKEEHTTNPPPRYTEASLIKTLEKYGIGRPSTYAPTLSILFNRGYVKREKRTLIPLKIGILVSDILTQYFSDIINTKFTAQMEDNLDKIVEGDVQWTELISKFYSEFKPMLTKAEELVSENIKKLEEKLVGDKVCPTCNVPLVVKRGKFGMFLGCPSFPNCKYTERIKENVNYSRNRYKKRQDSKTV